MIVRGRYGDTFGGIRGGHWEAGLALGVAALPVLGGACVRGDWLLPVKESDR